MKKAILKSIKEFIDKDKKILVQQRIEKFSNMGIVKE
jgi:acetyl-CoA carboxylase alpha subunit